MATAPDARPELESGDRLTREEFHRRYEARPDIWKAELIGGVVYLGPQRVSTVLHGQPCALMAAWLGVYTVNRPDVTTAIRSSVFLTDDSEVQPDVILIRDPELPHAAARPTDDGYLEGAPELVAEIAASSASYDLHDKKEAYRRAGIREYIVWRVLDEAIDWFRLGDGDYSMVEPDADGVIESAVFPGLRLPVSKMLAGDGKAVLTAVGMRFEDRREPA